MEQTPRVLDDRNLPAAVTQCFSVVALCTAVADPNWFQVTVNGTSPHMYGVAYVVRLQGNISADSHSVLNPKGLSLLVVMAACCYIGILMGFGAFILSFLGSRQANLFKIPTILHCLTAFLYGGALVLCVYMFTQVKFKLLKKQFQTAQVKLLVGESFTMAVFALFFSLAASVLSLLHPNIRNPRYTQITDEECSTLIRERQNQKIVE